MIVDEQHRFGVLQRKRLAEKGAAPHALVMTATPIPRTLALTLYGDLDISMIDEMPPGRTPVETRWSSPEQLAGVWEFVRREVAAGRQAYVIYPVIEESKQELKAATAEYERLSKGAFSETESGPAARAACAARKRTTSWNASAVAKCKFWSRPR